jgi:hypothetical protein
MKIGLSFSRCVRDIVDGKVDISEVLIVISRTDFDPHNDEQWKGIWEGYGGGQTFGSPYSNPEWIDYPAEDEDRFRSVSIELWESGKFHQPRQFGARPQRLPYYWLEAGLQTDDIESNVTVKRAWEQFQIVSGLASIKQSQIVNDNF